MADALGLAALLSLLDIDWPAPDPYGVRLVEGEDGGTFFAPGHVDPFTFARSVDHYATEVCGLIMGTDTEPAEPDEARHLWAVTQEHYDDGRWRITWGDVTERTLGAFPVTVMQR